MQFIFPKKYIFLLAVAAFSAMAFRADAPAKLHPFHVSNTEMQYGKNKTMEITCKIFTDDFETLLSKLYKVKIDLSNPKMQLQMDILVKKYISDALKLKINQKNMALKYIGFEIDKEATNIYLESNPSALPQKIEVENTILYPLFDDETNIVHLIVKGIRKSEKIDYPDKILAQNF